MQLELWLQKQKYNDGFSFLKLIIQVKVAERRYYLTDPKDQLEFLKTFVDDDQSQKNILKNYNMYKTCLDINVNLV